MALVTEMRVIQVIFFFFIVFTLFILFGYAGVRKTDAQIMDLNAPPKLIEGSDLRLSATIKNTGSNTSRFYLGASIFFIDGKEWIKLPGWGYTREINPNNTTTYVFGDYISQTGSDYGYYDLNITVWRDSSRTEEITERLYPARSSYWWNTNTSSYLKSTLEMVCAYLQSMQTHLPLTLSRSSE